MARVGHIVILDADMVDESNLERQIFHGPLTSSMVHGVSKWESAQCRFMDLNPFVNVRTYKEEFTFETSMHILGKGYSETIPYYSKNYSKVCR